MAVKYPPTNFAWVSQGNTVKDDGLSITNSNAYRYLCVSLTESGLTTIIFGRPHDVVRYINNRKMAARIYRANLRFVSGYNYGTHLVNAVKNARQKYKGGTLLIVNLLMNYMQVETEVGKEIKITLDDY